MSNDVCVGWTQTGEWLAYDIDIRAAGPHAFEFLTATIDDGCRIALSVDGAAAGTVAVANTGSYQSFQAGRIEGVSLADGPHRVVLTFTGGFNLDWLSYAPM